VQITKLVDTRIKVEVEVTFADLVNEMKPSVENTRSMLSGFSILLTFVKAVPDELLSTMNEKQREIIMSSLTEQMSRIASAKVEPTPAAVEA